MPPAGPATETPQSSHWPGPFLLIRKFPRGMKKFLGTAGRVMFLAVCAAAVVYMFLAAVAGMNHP